MNPSDTRPFGGIARLYGPETFERIEHAHVCVVGLGGVGSWCAEALARSGVGRLTLIDGDTVAPSNLNRQLPALTRTVGLAKARVLAERFCTINPQGIFTPVEAFVSAETPGELIPEDVYIVDAIDSIAAKAALCAWAHSSGRTILVSGGAGGRTDPSRVTSGDLARASGDALLSRLRTELRKRYGFAAGNGNPAKTRPFGICAVYSTEPARKSADPAHEAFGTAMPATAAMGLKLASLMLAQIAAAAGS